MLTENDFAGRHAVPDPSRRERFARRLIRWQKQHGRHDLPWQNTRDPYRVWLSEIMLQQTRVAAVIPYYARFLARFPTLQDLAAAPVEDVMAQWSGLGYYARARNLHACAKVVAHVHGGIFPGDPDAIAELPGIGRSTANAIAVFCFNARVAILDGNVKRVLARCFGIDGFPGVPIIEKKMWRLANEQLPTHDMAAYIQGQMDLGATLCTRGKPGCDVCPLQDICVARREGRVAELPTPRPKRAMPEKQVTLLVLLHQGSVLLEQRPPSGIWGSLLSLPELPAAAAAEHHARSHLGCDAEHWQALPDLVRTFTHFRLHISPVMATARQIPGVSEPGLRWMAFDSLASAPLPAPIRRILRAVQRVLHGPNSCQ